MRSSWLDSPLAVFIVVWLVGAASALFVQFVWPDSHGVSWWFLFASVPASLALAVGIGRIAAQLLATKESVPRRLGELFSSTSTQGRFRRGVAAVLSAFWCLTFIPGVSIEAYRNHIASIERRWGFDGAAELYTRFDSSKLHYRYVSTATESEGHPRQVHILIDLRDSRNHLLGTFGINHHRLSNGIAEGSEEFPRHVQLNGVRAEVTFVPDWAQTQCSDGWFSRSTGRGTCSHHGGIRRGLRQYFR